MSGAARRILGWPARRVLDRRVQWTVDEIDNRLGSEGQARPNVHARLDDLDSMGRQTLAALGRTFAPGRGLEVGLDELDAATAAFLNWADGPDGFAAQAGLWFNPPVPVEHHEGRVGLLLVNERVVEQPYVFAAVGTEPRRVLDVGGTESTVGLSLAALGHDVTVVDPRPAQLAHPRLTSIAARLEDLPADLEPFDIVVALSAIEHFGLEHYGTPRGDERADAEALRHIRGRLRPGGELVLTVPLGVPGVDDFQRTYDVAGVRELLAGWDDRDLTVARQADRLTWVRADADAEDTRRGVAMVRAVPA
jgi:SAM-dependent methyltransferase